MTHHDIDTPGYDGGRFGPFEIENVDILINGHIHRRLEPVQRGRTLWLTPGNISRRSRVEAIRDHVPSVLQLDIEATDWTLSDVPVPHQPADKVFHETILVESGDETGSQFVDGLRELQLRRTDSGAGLHQFLEQNLGQFDDDVAGEIRQLAQLVTDREASANV